MPVTMARLPGFQSAKSARWYQALTGPTQATGSAGGYDCTEKTRLRAKIKNALLSLRKQGVLVFKMLRYLLGCH